jgi:hypothetical protein
MMVLPMHSKKYIALAIVLFFLPLIIQIELGFENFIFTNASVFLSGAVTAKIIRDAFIRATNVKVDEKNEY